jgi:hypothetical protein
MVKVNLYNIDLSIDQSFDYQHAEGILRIQESRKSKPSFKLNDPNYKFVDGSLFKQSGGDRSVKKAGKSKVAKDSDRKEATE